MAGSTEETIYVFRVEGKAQALRDFAEIESAKNRAAGGATGAATRATRGGGGGPAAGLLPGEGGLPALGTAGAAIGAGGVGTSELERAVARRVERTFAQLDKVIMDAARRGMSGSSVGGPGGISHGGGASGLPFTEPGGGGIPPGGRVAGASPGRPYETRVLGLEDLVTNPAQVQFRQGVNRRGVTNRLDNIDFDASQAGIIRVGQSPDQPGKYTVIDAHHRYEAAMRDVRAGKLRADQVRFTAEVYGTSDYGQMRHIGARANISGGSATPRDVAQYMRETGDYNFGPNISGVREGTALSRLSDPLYQQYQQYRLSERKALALAQLEDQGQQNQIFQQIRDAEGKRGSALSDEVVERIVKGAVNAPVVVAAAGGGMTDMFGGTGPTTALANIERAQIESAVLSELRGGGRIFGRLSGKKGAGSGILKAAGIEFPEEMVGRFAGLQGESTRLAGLFETLSGVRGGPVETLLNQGAAALAGGGSTDAIVASIVKEVLGRSGEIAGSVKNAFGGGGGEAFDIGEIAAGAPAAPVATPAAGGAGGRGGGGRRRTRAAGPPEDERWRAEGFSSPEEREAHRASVFAAAEANQIEAERAAAQRNAERYAASPLDEGERIPAAGGGTRPATGNQMNRASMEAQYRSDPSFRRIMREGGVFNAFGVDFAAIDAELGEGAADTPENRRRRAGDKTVASAIRVATGVQGGVSPRVDQDVLRRGIGVATRREDESLTNFLSDVLDERTNRGVYGQRSRETLRERRQRVARDEEDTILSVNTLTEYGDNTTARLAVLTKQKSIATKRLVDATAKGFTDQIKVYQEAVDNINTEMAGIKNAGKMGFGAPQGGITGALQEAGFKAFPYTIGAFAIQSGGAPFAAANQRWTTAYQQFGRFNPEDSAEQLRSMELEARLGEQGAGTRRAFGRAGNAFLGAVADTGLAGPVAAAGDVGSAILSNGLNLAGLGIFARSIAGPAVRGVIGAGGAALGAARGALPGLLAGAPATLGASALPALGVAALAAPIVINPEQSLVRGPQQVQEAAQPWLDRIAGTSTPLGWVLGRWRGGATPQEREQRRMEDPAAGLYGPAAPSPAGFAAQAMRTIGASPGFRQYESGQRRDAALAEASPISARYEQAELGEASARRSAALGVRDILNAERQEVIGGRRFEEDQERQREQLQRDYGRAREEIGIGGQRRERDINLRASRQRRDIGIQVGDSLEDIEIGAGRQIRDINTQAAYGREDIGRNLGRTIRDIGIGAGRSREDIERGYGRGMEDLVLGQIGGLAGGFLSLGLNRSRALEDLERGVGNAKEDAARGAGDALADVDLGAGRARNQVGVGAGDARADVGRGADRAYRNAGTAAEDALADSAQATADALADLERQFTQRTDDLKKSQDLEKQRYDEDVKERQRLRADQLAEIKINLELQKAANQSVAAQKAIIDESVINIGKANDAIRDIPAAVRTAIASALGT